MAQRNPEYISFGRKGRGEVFHAFTRWGAKRKAQKIADRKGKEQWVLPLKEFDKMAKKNPVGLQAMVRRLPDGRVQVKIPLPNPNSAYRLGVQDAKSDSAHGYVELRADRIKYAAGSR